MGAKGTEEELTSPGSSKVRSFPSEVELVREGYEGGGGHSGVMGIHQPPQVKIPSLYNLLKTSFNRSSLDQLFLFGGKSVKGFEFLIDSL